MEERTGAAVAGAGTGTGGVHLARYSLDVSDGCGGRHSTLLDEYERLAFESQLNCSILRRCSSEPSPARTSFVVQPAADDAPQAPRGTKGEEAGTGGRSACGLHQLVVRLLEALKPVLCWLRSAWELRRREEQATPRGPPTVPRVRLQDYLC